MAELKMPELNSVIVAGNLTKDPVFRQTSNTTPVVNFHIAANRRYKDSTNQWQEDVCYVGVVAWNKLADSCRDRLKKGSAVLIDGEMQSRTFKTEDGKNRTIVEIKAKRIQFLNKFSKTANDDIESVVDDSNYEDNSFDKFLTDEESDLIKEV
jgi:single-strand DNA-binding protein